jgi:hypothetical protein
MRTATVTYGVGHRLQTSAYSFWCWVFDDKTGIELGNQLSSCIPGRINYDWEAG